MIKRTRGRSAAIAAVSGAIAIAACAPTWASLIFNGVTYTLLQSTTADPKTDQFTLEISGINAPVNGSQGDTEGGRFGVNAFAFNQPSPGSVVSAGPVPGFTFTMGGLNSSGCNMTGNFFCFLANSTPGGPALSANSELTYTFDVTVTNASGFVNYDPAFKIDWVGTKNNYSLVSQTLTPTPVPLPATLPLLVSAIAGLGFIGRRRTA